MKSSVSRAAALSKVVRCSNLSVAMRVVLFSIAMAYIWGGPFLRQVVRSKNDHLPRWIMFSGTALDLLDVRYERALPDRSRQRVDHVAILGGGPPGSGKGIRSSGWRLTDRDKGRLKRITRRLCSELGGDAQLFLTTRVAERSGWRTEEDGTVDVCNHRRSKRGGRKGGPGKRRNTGRP